MKILYIPADNITANFSRSYHIAKNLSPHCDLYRVIWDDNRSILWEGKKASSLNGLKCFLNSIFQKDKIVKSSDFGYEVYSSVFISAFVGRIIGKYRALKWMRKYNALTLKKIVEKIKPDIIFHADGYYFFPALNSNIPEFSDLQDDINWSNIPNKNLNEAKNYYTKQFSNSKLNFIVSESAKSNIIQHISTEFTPISNGADFDEISNISNNQQEKFRSKFKIPNNKKIASYIGGAHKFDIEFTKKLTQKAEKELPDLIFVLAGNLPSFEANNVIFTNIISNKEANVLYTISDLGLTLKNTKNNDFIYNSVPLKFIQYAAAKKHIVTFPIKWSVDHNFKNITHIDNENIDEWILAVKNILNKSLWNNDLDIMWKEYDWKTIGKSIINEIKNNI
tara:strand:- start:203 stop:1381 length:1179 start_codon:yes stop_codon:yes gene_type:complete